MAQKPSIPKGTRDFSPQEMAKRNYIFDTIKSVFLLYGFQPIETPAMENLSTLMGKYGEEGDKLLFKILNSGDYLKNAPDELLANKDYIHLITKLSEKGLRYDLTVPFMWFSIATTCRCHLSAIKFNPCGVPIVLSVDVIASSISVMPTLWVAIPYSTRLS